MIQEAVCNRCGAFGDLPHGWVEGDCVLPHKNHSTRLVTGAQVCVHCVERWREGLTEIVELYSTLYEVVPNGSIPDDTAEHKHTKKAAGSPAQFRLEAWALLHPEYLNTSIRVEGEWRETERTGLPDVHRVLWSQASAFVYYMQWTTTVPENLSGMTALLSANAEHVARSPWADSFDADLRWLLKALRQAHGKSAPHRLGQCLTVTPEGECKGSVWPAKPDDPDKRPVCSRCARRYGTTDLVRLNVVEKSESLAAKTVAGE